MYDSKGEVTRTRIMRRPVANEDPRLQNTSFLGAEDTVPDSQLEDWQSMWGGEHFTEPKTGFTMSWYMLKFWIDYPTMPRDIVNVDNLTKEPVRKIIFWE